MADFAAHHLYLGNKGVGGFCRLAPTDLPFGEPLRRIPQVSGISVIRHASDVMLDFARSAISIATMCAIFAGPPILLLLWKRRVATLPRLLPFLIATTLLLTLVIWTTFSLSEWFLELQFLEIVPDGSWTDADEARWSDRDRHIVRAYFGDGGRNVMALFSPILVAPYAGITWLLARWRAV